MPFLHHSCRYNIVLPNYAYDIQAIVSRATVIRSCTAKCMFKKGLTVGQGSVNRKCWKRCLRTQQGTFPSTAMCDLLAEYYSDGILRM